MDDLRKIQEEAQQKFMVTLQIATSRFGTVEVEEKNVIHFISPILGFEAVKRYVLLDHAEDSPFRWLQAADNPDLAFVITNPHFFGLDFEFVLPEEAVSKLEVEKAEDVLVFTIVNIPQDNPAKMTANLLAPIVINPVKLQGMQLVLQNTNFSTRTRLVPDPSPEGRLQGSATRSFDKG